MVLGLDRARRSFPVLLGALTLAAVAGLLVCDVLPGLFPARSHDLLAAFSLTAIAVAYLAYQAAQRPPILELVKAILLATAFLCWAANQLWPGLPQATEFNDVAIALFVLDLFLVIVGGGPAPTDSSFVEAGRVVKADKQF